NWKVYSGRESLAGLRVREGTPFLLDHLIRPRQHGRRNSKADLLSCLQIDDELKLRRLLHREVSRLGPFEDFVHGLGGPAPQVSVVRSIRHEASSVYPPALPIYCR